MQISTLLKKLAGDESGATAIEYGLLAATISVAIIVGAGAAGTALNTLFSDIAKKLTIPAPPA